MKKFYVQVILLAAFVLMVPFIASAQGNGNGNGNGSWPPVAGESCTACGVTSSVVTPTPPGGAAPTIQQGWPMNKVVEILREARPHFPATNLGQMIQSYNACSCVISYLGENRFRVQLGGDSIVLVLADIL